MYLPAPRIDERSAPDVFEAVAGQLTQITPWSRPDEIAEALIRVFARYAEITIDRLNRVPEKNLLAFLNLLGVTPVPAQPARVPLTFLPVDGVTATVRVPAQTQVAAPPGEGETEPVVFETERALELTTGRLRQLFFLHPARDAQIELQPLADAVVANDSAIWQNSQLSDHVLFLAHQRLFGLAQNARLRLRFEIEAGPPHAEARPEIEWAILAGGKQLMLKPGADTTDGLSRTGEVVFENLPTWPEQEWRSLRSRWLACRLRSGLHRSKASLWAVGRIEITAEVRLRQVPVELVFPDGQATDVSKDFLPLGIRPMFGSTLYIASHAAFSHAGTRVTLNVKLTNPYHGTEPSPIPTVYVDGHPRVWWEYWNGTVWTRLAENDSTRSFRVDGAVGFRIPEGISKVSVNGIESYWIRARLASGNYGEEERWEAADPLQPAAGLRRRPSTLSPPSIQAMTIDYELDIPSETPEAAITCNERVCENVTDRVRAGAQFGLFGFPDGERPALYLGIDAPSRTSFVNRSLSLYLQILDRAERPVSRDRSKTKSANFFWQYWSRSDWLDLDIVDGTDALSRSGLISFIVPENASVRGDFADGPPCYWFRIVARAGFCQPLAQLRGILRNTTLATHSVRLDNEVLGSSNGTLHQRFVAARTPILKDIELQVREADLPSEVERVLRSVSAEAVEVQRNEAGRAQEAWVRWTEVADLLASEPEDRHYTVNRQTGEIRFGDGRRGRIPPRASNNIRLRRYQVGGGARGNKAPNTIKQLRAAIPYVQSATNLVAASGGFDREDMRTVCERGARLARHRNRAVTAEDYEDLARLASPDVARARCIPMRDLAADPDASRFYLGTVSLIIVSKSGGRKPDAGVSLLDRVREFVHDRGDASAELIVVGPEHVRISVEAEFVPVILEDAGATRDAVLERLAAFLHPLHGGSGRRGWSFGQLPHRSDLYGVVASVRGVHSVRSLRITTAEERIGTLDAGNFLIYSGDHDVSVSSGAPRRSPAMLTDVAGLRDAYRPA